MLATVVTHLKVGTNEADGICGTEVGEGREGGGGEMDEGVLDGKG